MTTRPTDTPEWATTGTITEPPAAKQSLGWLFQDRPPFDFVNWAWSRFALWSAHLASAASKFASVEAAFAATPATAAPLVVGDTFILGEDFAGSPGEHDIALNGPALAIAGEVVGGEVIYLDSAGVLTAYERDGTGLIRTYAAHGLAATPFGVRADDNYVAIWALGAVSPNVEVYDRATGASLFTATVAGAVGDIALGINRIYVGFANTGGIDLTAFDAAGAVVWSYDHNGVGGQGVGALAAHGPYLYLHGEASTHASSATMRAIEAANGFDAAGEGGLGTSTLPGVWDDATAAAITGTNREHRLVTDGRVLANRNGPTTLEVRGTADGTVATSRTVPSMAGPGAIDDDNVYIGPTGTGQVIAYSRPDALAAAWVYESDTSTGTHIISSDGDAVFSVDQSAVTRRTPRIRRGNRPRLWQRVDPAVDPGLPYRRGVV